MVKIASTKSISNERIEDVEIKLPYNIYLSHDLYNNRLEHKVMVKGKHKTLGIQITHDLVNGKLKLKQCLPGTPSARLPKWRSELKNSTILKVNDEDVKDVKTIEQIIKKCRKNDKKYVKVVLVL